MTNIKYTIVIPAYNSQRFINGSIASVKKQSYPFFECLIVDDGSTDETVKVAKELTAGDKRFTVISKTHSGLSATRNAGLTKARGEYILFFDCDDELDPNILSRAEEMIEGCDVLLGGIDFVYYEDDCEVKRTPVRPPALEFASGHELAAWYVRNHVILLYSACNKIYSTAMLRKNGIFFDEQCFWGEDRLFNYEVLSSAGTIRTVDDLFYNYRQINPESMTHVFMSHHIDTLLYLHERKMAMILPIAESCSSAEKAAYMRYDIRKEVYNALSYLTGQKNRISSDLYKSELDYLRSHALPSYFYVDGNDAPEDLVAYLNRKVFDDAPEKEEKVDFVAILGSRACEYRVAHAFAMYGSEMTYICSGGNCSHYTNDDGSGLLEADFMRDYLLKKGVPAAQILVEDRSHNTRENLANISDMCPADARIAVVTASFHKRRVVQIINELGLNMAVYGTDGPNTSKENWYLNETGVDAIFAEFVSNIVRL